jgi:hypothetical protein
MRYLICPGCGKKGVWNCMTRQGGDVFLCRYCDWYAYATGNDTFDVQERRRLVASNPGPEAAFWVGA